MVLELRDICKDYMRGKLVAQETGAQTAVLDPLEGLDEEGRKQGLSYLKIMEQNITNLQKALHE